MVRQITAKCADCGATKKLPPSMFARLASPYRCRSCNLAQPSNQKFSDRDILTILDLRDYEGLSAARIAERYGVTRNSIIGLTNRIMKDEQPCHCVKPENKDAGMPRGWWK